MDKESIEKLLNRFRRRRDYFNSIDFILNAKDLTDAIETIEELLKENENISNKDIEKNNEEMK